MDLLLGSDLLTPEEQEEALRITNETIKFLSSVQKRILSDPEIEKRIGEALELRNEIDAAYLAERDDTYARKLFRQVSLKYHPDKGGDEKKMQVLGEMKERNDICGLLNAKRGIFIRKESRELQIMDATLQFYVDFLKTE